MLPEFWRDVVALVSAIITIASWGVAIRQIRKTKAAAVAAGEAANRAAESSGREFRRYALANALRLLAEMKIYLDARQWEMAMLRLRDLAEQVSQFVEIDEEWDTLAQELRKWEKDLRGLGHESATRTRLKWEHFLLKLQVKIDRSHGPFKASPRGRAHDATQSDQ